MDDRTETHEKLNKKSALRRGAPIQSLEAQMTKELINSKQSVLDKNLEKISVKNIQSRTPKNLQALGIQKSLKFQQLVRKLQEKMPHEENKYNEDKQIHGRNPLDIDFESDSEPEIKSEESDESIDNEIKAKMLEKRNALGDDFNLQKVFSHEKEPQTYKPIKNKLGFILMILYFSIYLIVASFFTIRTSDSYQLASAVRSIFETFPIDSTSKTYININDKNYVKYFFSNVLIPQIFDESIKQYSSSVDGYHFITNYNYFGGMRITHNRVELAPYSKGKLHDRTRQENYNGRTNQRFTDIIKDIFYLYDKEYSEDGGYFHKGGYVYFLPDNTTYDEAKQFAEDAEYNWVFDDEYLTLTFEMLFYNQNLQAGVMISYEFLNNNAAMIEKFVFVDTFFVSPYSENNMIFSPGVREIMIC